MRRRLGYGKVIMNYESEGICEGEALFRHSERRKSGVNSSKDEDETTTTNNDDSDDDDINNKLIIYYLTMLYRLERLFSVKAGEYVR